MSSLWQVTDLYGAVRFARGAGAADDGSGGDAAAQGEPIEAQLAALEVPSWFPADDAGRDANDVLEAICASFGLVPLDASRDADLLRARLVELLEAGAVVAHRMPPPAASEARMEKPPEPPPLPPPEPVTPPPEPPPEEVKPPCKLTSETVAKSPKDRARTKIGVGEEVWITCDPGPATWKITSGKGKLRPAGSQSKVKFTAPDRKATVVIEATSPNGTCSITFTVVEPSSWSMKRQKGTGLKHTNGRPNCGWLGIMYVHPNDVNFYRIETREKDSKYVGTGSYAGYNGTYHGNYPLPDQASAWFPITAHTEARGSTDNAPDTIDTGDPGAAVTGAAPPFVVGAGHFPITIQWRIGSGKIKDFPIRNQEDEIFSDGKCESRKGGHTEHTMYNDPTSTV